MTCARFWRTLNPDLIEPEVEHLAACLLEAGTKAGRVGAQPMQMGERVMRGMVMVPGPDVAADDALAAWMDQAVAIARAEPPKPPKGPKKPKKP